MDVWEWRGTSADRCSRPGKYGLKAAEDLRRRRRSPRRGRTHVCPVETFVVDRRLYPKTFYAHNIYILYIFPTTPTLPTSTRSPPTPQLTIRVDVIVTIMNIIRRLSI